MSSHTRLLRRDGGTYYLRVRVPDALRATIGKTEIRESLRTKDKKEALKLVKIASLRVDCEFEEATRELTGNRIVGEKMTQAEIAWIVADYLISSEYKEGQWIGKAIEDYPEGVLRDIADDLKTDAVALDSHSATSEPGMTNAGTGFLDEYLQTRGQRWGIVPGDDNYQILAREFRRAKVEVLNRSIDRLEGKERKQRHLNEYTAFTNLPPPPKEQITFGRYREEFLKYQRESNSNTTPAAYAMPLRALGEAIGEQTLLCMVTRKHIEKALELLQRAPLNMTQRYKGLSFERAIEAAKRENRSRTISRRTVWNYYVLITAFFNYAKEECGYLDVNPAKSRAFRAKLRVEKESLVPRLFSEKELKAIFSAPLYTGSIDDRRNYAKPGPNIYRRGRFWVPLLALFHGTRSNETCQLYVEDVKEIDGIPYLSIRNDLDDESKTVKHIKNKSSRRNIPLHPEVLRMGFLDYVEERRRDNSIRLFPDLPIAKATDRFSSVFGKWFSHFLVKSCGAKPRATFHAFRRHFATKLEAAGVSEGMIEKLAGWRAEGMLRTVYVQRDMPALKDAISKLEYPYLDFSHLYVKA